MIPRRQPRGYGGLGVVWCFDKNGRTVIFNLGPWRWSYHRTDPEFQRQIEAAARR